MQNLKAVIILTAVILIVLFAIQNVEVVDIRFLLWGFSLPRAVLVFVLLGIGFLLGLLVASLYTMKHR